MLEELRVSQLALIDEAEVTFRPGLNVLSGETGEGKSLLLGAVLLLLGARADKAAVRGGADEASIEGRFALRPAAARRLAGATDLVSPDDEEICLRRAVQADGRSRAYLNGHLCPAGLLKTIGDLLCDVHSQRDHQALLRTGDQRRALDSFAGLAEPLATHGARYSEWISLCDSIRGAAADTERRAARRLELEDHVDELRRAQLVRGELSALDNEWRLLGRSADLVRMLDDGATGLSDGDGAVTVLAAKLTRRLADFASLDPSLAAIAERFDGLKIEAADLARTCERLRDRFDHDGARLAEVGARLDLLRALCRKYRAEGDLLIDRFEAMKEELAGLDRAPSVERLEAQRKALAAELHESARALREARRTAGRDLASVVVKTLHELRLPNVQFVVDPGDPRDSKPLTDDALTAHGYGTPQFLVSANVGEPARPLADVASGGELARMLLALKGALAGHHETPLLIFDEIDSGVGGRVGTSLGRRLRELSKHHQVLVVTHLAQVAAFADHHLLVRKRVSGPRTVTSVVALDRPSRVRELAEMLAGAGDHPHAQAQARELLAEAAS